MSNSRLVAIEGQEVVFRYRDHRDGGTRRTTALPGVEFIERFLWHLIPRGLRASAASTWWGNAVRTEKLALLRGSRACGRPRRPTRRRPRSGRERRTNRRIRSCGGWRRNRGRCAVPRLRREDGAPYQTGRSTVAELLRMPPSRELLVETGPLQLHLPLSAFL